MSFQKQFVVLFLFLLQFYWGNCQNVSYRMGDRVEFSERGGFKFFNYDSLYIYAFGIKNYGSIKKYFILTYDRDSLKERSNTKVPFPETDSVEYNWEDIIIHNDYYQLFYSYFDKSVKKEILQMINFNKTGSKKGEPKTIDFSEGKKEKKAGRFFIINWAEKNEFLSYNSKQINDVLKINIDHFDHDGNKLRSQNFDLNLDGYSVIHTFIDWKCNQYYILFNKRANKAEQWKVQVFSPESESPFVYNISDPALKDAYLSHRFRLLTDSLKRTNIITTYSNSNESGYPLGIYWMRFDANTHKLLLNNIVPFKTTGKNFYHNYKDFNFSYAMMTHTVSTYNNGIKLVYESRLGVNEYIYFVKIDSEFDLDDIVTFSLDSSMKTVGVCRIPKKQHVNSDNSKYAGYTMFQKGSASYFIYNELPLNMNVSSNDKVKKVKNSKVDETVILLTATNDSSITDRKIIVNREKQGIVDAILPNFDITTDREEVYTLREIDGANYLIKFFIKD